MDYRATNFTFGHQIVLLVIRNTSVVSFVLFSSFAYALYDRYDAQIRPFGTLQAKIPEKVIFSHSSGTQKILRNSLNVRV